MAYLSGEQKKKEIEKCFQDPVYFINNYCKISHPTKGRLPFKLFDYQEDLVHAFINNRFNIILKARQLGISTVTAAFACWVLLFRRDKTLLVVATKVSTAANLVKKVQLMYDNIPEWLQVSKPKTNNRHILELENGSWIKAESTQSSSGRSEALSYLIIDEAAHVEGLSGDGGLWAAAYPTLSCVIGDTLVLTDKGFRRIEEFHETRAVGDYFEIENLKVFGKNGIEEVSHGYVSPNHKTFIITTQHGYEVEVTPIHPLWTLCDEAVGMKKAENIKIGDHLRIHHSMRQFGDFQLDKDFAYMIGGYIAKGWITQNQQIWISNTDDEFRDVFLSEDTFGEFSVDKSSQHKLRFGSKDAVNYLKHEIGIDPEWKCDTKQTPEIIFKCDEKTQCQYLAGLFDGDGSICDNKAILCSTSLKLIEETQMLLNNIGILSNIIYIDPEPVLERERRSGRLLPQGKPVQSLRDSWGLEIQRGYLKKFNEKIELRIERKKERLEEYANKYSESLKQLTIPVNKIKEEFREIFKKSGKSAHWFRKNGARIDRLLRDNERTKYTTQDLLTRFFNLLDKDLQEEHQEFKDNFANLDIFWDKIVKIEKSHNKTYDFTVPGTHTFLQNCILGSNTGGNCIALSTPCGVGDWFHEKCMGAINGENEFILTKLMWDVHPERDQAWFDKETRNMSRRQIAQELLCNFNASGETVVGPDDIERIEKFLEEPDEINPGKKYGDPLYKTHAEPVYDRNLWVWEEYNPDHRYLISADVARGDGKDFSAFHILDYTINHIVAEYKGQPEPDKFSEMLNNVGRRWGQAMIVVEGNMLGYSVVTELEKLEYPNIYYEKKTTHEYIEPHLAEYTAGVSKGFTTSMSTRPQIVAKMEEYIRNNEITFFSRRLHDEMKTFIWNNGKPEAMSGKNDDLVMAFAILCFIRDTVLTEDAKSQEHSVAVMKAFTKKSRTMDTSVESARNYHVGPYLGPKSKDRMRKRSLEAQARLYHKYGGLLKG